MFGAFTPLIASLALGPAFRKALAKALQQWLNQNPNWAVFADQWLEENV